jgi:hypothetical protein
VNGEDLEEVTAIEAVNRCKHAAGDAQIVCKIRKHADMKMVGMRDRAQGAARRECLGFDWWDKEAKCSSCTTKKQTTHDLLWAVLFRIVCPPLTTYNNSAVPH